MNLTLPKNTYQTVEAQLHSSQKATLTLRLAPEEADALSKKGWVRIINEADEPDTMMAMIIGLEHVNSMLTMPPHQILTVVTAPWIVTAPSEVHEGGATAHLNIHLPLAMDIVQARRVLLGAYSSSPRTRAIKEFKMSTSLLGYDRVLLDLELEPEGEK